MYKDRVILELMAKVDMLMKRVQQLETFEIENKDLKNRLLKYEHPKNSNNSSIPPSKDKNRSKQKSLQEKSDLKPDGQKG